MHNRTNKFSSKLFKFSLLHKTRHISPNTSPHKLHICIINTKTFINQHKLLQYIINYTKYDGACGLLLLLDVELSTMKLLLRHAGIGR